MGKKRKHEQLMSALDELSDIASDIRAEIQNSSERTRELDNRPISVLCGVNLRLFADKAGEGTAPSGFTEWLMPGEQRSYHLNPHQKLKGFEIAAWGGARIHDVKVGQTSLTFQIADGFTNVRYDECTVEVGNQIQIIYSVPPKP